MRETPRFTKVSTYLLKIYSQCQPTSGHPPENAGSRASYSFTCGTLHSMWHMNSNERIRMWPVEDYDGIKESARCLNKKQMFTSFWQEDSCLLRSWNDQESISLLVTMRRASLSCSLPLEGESKFTIIFEHGVGAREQLVCGKRRQL